VGAECGIQILSKHEVHLLAMPDARAITLLEKAYTRTIGDNFCIEQDPDVIEQLLSDTRLPSALAKLIAKY